MASLRIFGRRYFNDEKNVYEINKRMNRGKITKEKINKVVSEANIN